MGPSPNDMLSCKELTPLLQLCPLPHLEHVLLTGSHLTTARLGATTSAAATWHPFVPMASLLGGAWQPLGEPCPSPQVSQSFPSHQGLAYHHLLAQLGRNLHGSLLYQESW